MSRERLEALAREAKQAARVLALATADEKNRALACIAEALTANSAAILAANAEDVTAAQANEMHEGLLDRLTLTETRLRNIANAVRKVAALPDPVGRCLWHDTLPNGLDICRVSVPMGVVGIIYESRPNVTVDAAVLCLKAGSACVLRGGKETIRSNIALEAVMRGALREAGLPEGCVCVLHDVDRETANAMMKLNGLIDVLIPRGGAGLIRAVVLNATVPVIETGTGNCHIYVDKDANLDMACDIVFNAKTQRIGVCNAAESLLVHRDVAARFLPMVRARLQTPLVELRCCPEALRILSDCTAATEEDYGREFLDYILSVKVVGGVDEAADWIARYGTGHSDCIVSENAETAERFTLMVDSAAVYVNASTRFTDGEEFGFGAEIGISTQKLHARGPMALRELCSYKYIVRGQGQIRP